jgi:hypothetical protein
LAATLKKRQGYDIDISESWRSRIDTIIAQKQIKNEKELRDVSIMLDVYQQTSVDQKKIDILNSILIDYANRTSDQTPFRKNQCFSNQFSEASSPEP